jgi:hypothetical protein
MSRLLDLIEWGSDAPQHKREACQDARAALAELPSYLQSEEVVIDGERYIRQRTVQALFCHTEPGWRFHRSWVRWLPGRGMFFEEYGEGADDFIQAAFGPPAVK